MIQSGISTGIVVRLARPGAKPEEFHLPEGATLADLLRASGTLTADQSVLVGGVPLEDALTLTDGVVVTVMPSPPIDGKTPWQYSSAPLFGDDAEFREFMEIMKEQRRLTAPDEDLEG